MQQVVVTGGLGFIGSHVVDGLVSAGRDVTIVDSMVAAVTDGREYEECGCTVVRSSVADFFVQGGTFEGVDLVVHAASPVGPASILRDAGRLGTEIVTTAQLVVDACLQSGSYLCAFSSAEVYGRSGMLQEGDNIVVPTNYNARLEYAIAKVLTEAITVNSRQAGLRGLVIRPFNVAGPRQSRAGGFVMPTFVQQALAGRPLTVFASGDQVRSFLSAADLSRFITDNLEAAFAGDKAVFNIGSPDNATTVWKLAERVVELLESPSEIEFADARLVHGPLYEEAESFEKVPVLDAATGAGWSPTVTLDELILQTAEFYRQHEDPRTDDAAPLEAVAQV
jgi:nucleoside-diphosphate-sugar epimerase